MYVLLSQFLSNIQDRTCATRRPSFDCSSMSHTDDPSAASSELFLKVTVGRPSDIWLQFEPALCGASCQPVRTELYLPGAGSCEASVRPRESCTQLGSMKNSPGTHEICHEGASDAQPPNTVSKERSTCSSASTHNRLHRTPQTTKKKGTASRLSPGPSSVQTPPGSPAPSTIADSFGGSSDPPSLPGRNRKRKHEDAERNTHGSGAGSGEDEGERVCKKGSLPDKSIPL